METRSKSLYNCIHSRTNIYIMLQAGYICSIGSATFNAKDVYIFHYVAWQGPLLHHVYQWVGNNASKSLVHSAYEHCQMLAKCLPGRPVMHREVHVLLVNILSIFTCITEELQIGFRWGIWLISAFNEFSSF